MLGNKGYLLRRCNDYHLTFRLPDVIIQQVAFGLIEINLGSGLNFIGSRADLFLALILKNPFATSLIVPSPPTAAILLYPAFNNFLVIFVPALALFVKIIRCCFGRYSLIAA